jgi:hypothetical protein
MWDEGYVIVDGKISENKGDYYDKFNVVKVSCDLSKKQCIHSIGGIFQVNKESEFPPLLNVKTEQYLITNWNKEILIYKDFGSCYETTFTLIRNTKTLTGVKKFSKKIPTCQREEEITYSIVNGFDFVLNEQSKVRNVFMNTILFILILLVTVIGVFKTVKKS